MARAGTHNTHTGITDSLHSSCMHRARCFSNKEATERTEPLTFPFNIYFFSSPLLSVGAWRSHSCIASTGRWSGLESRPSSDARSGLASRETRPTSPDLTAEFGQ